MVQDLSLDLCKRVMAAVAEGCRVGRLPSGSE
jgi:hypothetical protein